jgi:hypothetical protein
VHAEQVKPQVNHHFQLGEAAKAHRLMEARQTSSKSHFAPLKIYAGNKLNGIENKQQGMYRNSAVRSEGSGIK